MSKKRAKQRKRRAEKRQLKAAETTPASPTSVKQRFLARLRTERYKRRLGSFGRKGVAEEI